MNHPYLATRLEDLLRARHRCIAYLRRRHREKSELEVTQALRQASSLLEFPSRQRVRAIASMLMAYSFPLAADETSDKIQC